MATVARTRVAFLTVHGSGAVMRAAVRQFAGPKAILVTPGVRSNGAEKGDQKRVAIPAEAIRNGADCLVIGRGVTRSEDPRTEARP